MALCAVDMSSEALREGGKAECSDQEQQTDEAVSNKETEYLVWQGRRGLGLCLGGVHLGPEQLLIKFALH